MCNSHFYQYPSDHPAERTGCLECEMCFRSPCGKNRTACDGHDAIPGRKSRRITLAKTPQRLEKLCTESFDHSAFINFRQSVDLGRSDEILAEALTQANGDFQIQGTGDTLFGTIDTVFKVYHNCNNNDVGLTNRNSTPLFTRYYLASLRRVVHEASPSTVDAVFVRQDWAKGSP